MIRIPPQTIVMTDDPNPLSQTNVRHPAVTRTVTIPPYPWNSVEAKNNDIKPVTYTSAADKKNGPPCANLTKCGRGCLLPVFCHGPCSLCGGGGFAAGNDPNPLPNPNPGPPNPDDEDPDDEDDCDDEIATATDVWVSCKTFDSTSTSCTTTSSNVHTGCRATASATTTTAAACYVMDPDADQGQDGGAVTTLVTTDDPDKITAVPNPTPTGAAPTNGLNLGRITISYYWDEHSGDGEWDLYEWYDHGLGFSECPEVQKPNFVKTDGAYKGLRDGNGGFKAFGSTCTYKGTNLPTGQSGQEVGTFVCDGYRDATCYTGFGARGSCAQGWLQVFEVVTCKW